MIFPLSNDSNSLLEQALSLNLYNQLLVQIQKDFGLANAPISIENNCNPEKLKNVLVDKIFDLINHRFDDYLNVLYLMDVSEEEVKKLSGHDLQLMTQEVVFLILKREWKKVWFRNHYK
jgi:hypothetical protein